MFIKPVSKETRSTDNQGHRKTADDTSDSNGSFDNFSDDGDDSEDNDDGNDVFSIQTFIKGVF